MQKFVTKKLLFTLSGACLLAWWIIYAAGPQIIIDPTRFVSQQRIQRINLNSTGTNTVKEALLNSWSKKPVLLIGSTPGNDNLWAVTRNNTITWDVSSVIWWKGNSNLWDETSLIAWSQDSIVEKNVKSTVILWWKNNTGSAANQVILSSEKTNVSKINDVAIWISNSNIDSSYAIGLIWDKITISWASNSVALWSNINIQTWWMFIFNANWGTVNWNLKDTVFINAEHWLVIWGPKIIPSTVSNSKAVKLTVHGWVALWQGKCSKDTIGGIYYASGTTKTNGKISCICACVASGSTAKSIAVSNQPYCDVACKNTEGAWGNEKIDGSAVCGSRGYPWSWSRISQEHWKEMIYESWETTWRPNSDFCKDWSMPEVGTLDSHTPWVVDFPWTWMTVSWVCPWLTANDPKVQCNAYKKVVPPKCWENAKKYYLNDEAYPIYSELAFCEVGEFLWAIPNKTFNDYDFPNAWSSVVWLCKTNSWHVDAIENKSCLASRRDCNHCAVNGFPYCFDVDFKASCPDDTWETPGNWGETPTEPGPEPTKTDGLCEYWKNGASCIAWTPQVISSNSCEYKWKCKSNDGWNDVTCSMSYTPDKTITVPGVGGHYGSYKITWNNASGGAPRCGNVGAEFTSSTTTYNSLDACNAVVNRNGGLDYWRSMNSPYGPCTQGSSYCTPCIQCNGVESSWVPNSSTTQVEKWSCVVDSVSYPSDDWRCSWIAPSCPAPTPSCVTVCHQYKKELTNQYGCSVSSSALGTTTYGDSDSCWAAAKTFGAVRSQSYWIGSTSWNKWDSCNIDTDPYCVPCVSCSCMPWATSTVCS